MATPHEQFFPARLDQVREARRFLAAVLNGCPAADDAILCLSELAANSVLHSDSRKASGTFTVRAEVHEGDYVWIEVEGKGGPGTNVPTVTAVRMASPSSTKSRPPGYRWRPVNRLGRMGHTRLATVRPAAPRQPRRRYHTGQRPRPALPVTTPAEQ